MPRIQNLIYISIWITICTEFHLVFPISSTFVLMLRKKNNKILENLLMLLLKIFYMLAHLFVHKTKDDWCNPAIVGVIVIFDTFFFLSAMKIKSKQLRSVLPPICSVAFVRHFNLIISINADLFSGFQSLIQYSFHWSNQFKASALSDCTWFKLHLYQHIYPQKIRLQLALHLGHSNAK